MRAEDGTPSVAIVGAGFGGLAAAIELGRHGIDYEVFERADSVGGVWRANAYPGAACDVPSPTYSFSYELETRWSARYGTQPEIHAYLRRCADRYGVTPRIRFGAEVTAATFVDGRWEIELASGERRGFDALICATGQLSRPRIPDLPGRSSFAGAQFHSAEWDPAVSVRGKRVAVVGSGASAIQLVPAIVDEVDELHVIQRSPNWVANKYNHGTDGIPHRLLRKVPGLARLEHNVEWLWFEARVPLIFTALDPVRSLFEAWLRGKIRREISDPALRAAVTPDYRVGCNRILLSNDWYPALDRDHVTLHPHGVREVRPDGLRLADGSEVAADVIVWCTGFTADEYLAPIDITGRDGRKLHTEWKDGPEAYLGISVAGYPNLFMMYGPNTGSITNTIIFLLEKQARYVRMALRHIARTGGWIDVRREVQDRFNARLRRRLARTVFTTGCPGWYHTADGKVFAVWPGSHIGYALATRRFDPRRYEFGARPQRA
ncbi:NAD(P)/FAD-dependent oxidoreductase [Nocardia sp. CDC159]|uniref:NAD(P)/FAD-dependent oxidoreductase n=1 Tax=Nocardia pulmonis TaxID=2951408 RepID=A0A9X2E3R9_9NOCA|nr:MULTISPECIES: NAD(P)/FAD-dependent oxidoreductase [Nocardia]MCM6772548.1 NAD(P)/FAD-dependent oxidoreductase [Nocardia pulmonis]MCM6784794.1 NAD(P)/FAD-dependent oxidoreductase [Nocardia sp. CDC159]